jgi:hypothetical protein
LLARALLQIDPANAIQHANYNKVTERTFYYKGQLKYHAYNEGFQLDEESLVWARTNITPDVNYISISKTPLGRDVSGAHTDLTRHYTMIYNVQSGGADHRTVFYQETDQPLLRDFKTSCNDYDALTEVASIQIPDRCWTALNARVVHGVVNIPNSRISIQLSLNNLDGIFQ